MDYTHNSWCVVEVVELKTVEGKVRYYLADDTGAPVPPVLKYLKFKDNTGYARNTLRMHCIHLKHFFTYLGEAGKDYAQVNIDDIAGFMAWLKNPDILKKIVAIRFEPEHQPQTINAMVDTVIMFYDYLLRHEGIENQLSEKLVKFVRDPGKNYRSFLHGSSLLFARMTNIIRDSAKGVKNNDTSEFSGIRASRS